MAVVEPLGSYDSETRADASRLNVVRLVDQLGPISPELVLVDPQLAAHARALLPDLEALPAPLPEEPAVRVEPRVLPSVGRTIPSRRVGAVILAIAAIAAAVFAWTSRSGSDVGSSPQSSSEPAPTFFSTPPTEADVSPDELAALEEGVRLDPRSPVAREALGIAFLRLGRWKEAERELRVLVELSPSDDFAHYALGRALVNQGRSYEAAKQFKLAESLLDGDAATPEPLP